MTPKVLYSLLGKSPANRECSKKKCKVLLKDAHGFCHLCHGDENEKPIQIRIMAVIF